LYRLAPAGVDVTLTIDAGTMNSIRVVDHAPPPRKPAPRGPAWFRGALHTHTLHSDGTLTPRELLQLFSGKAFDFVAITDHNNTTHPREFSDLYAAGHDYPLRIIGEEVTTPGGHASVWGLPPGGWVDFRVLPGDTRIRDLVASARRQGGIFSINHPASECLACGWTHDIAEGIEGIEISNGRHGEVENATAIWDKLLMSGRKITAVGSSDWHSAPNPIDNAHVRVYMPSLTQENVLSAIRAARVIVMTDADDETPEIVVRAGEVSASVGETLPIASRTPVEAQVVAASAPSGRLVVVQNGQRGTPLALDGKGTGRAEIIASPGYVRFEILRADGTALAYTNPVYLVR
jgi:predicted metal-dependent phosphoesterase TrpH